jgi:hypothetical protein
VDSVFTANGTGTSVGLNVGSGKTLSVAGTLTSTGTSSFSANPTFSGGTANGVTYLNGSKVLTSGSALVFDGSNLSVGATPQTWTNGRALELTGLNFSTVVVNSASSNAAARNWMMASNWNAFGDLCFVQGSSIGVKPDTIRMQIDPSGNLGLGVTPSAWESTYSVFDIGHGGSLFANAATYAAIQLSSNLYSSSAVYRFKRSGQAASSYTQFNGIHSWLRSTATTTAGNDAVLSTAMTLDASGNLGIGTTTPSSFDGSADNLVVGTTTGNNGITIAAGTASASTLNFADGTSGGAQYTGYIDYQHSGDYMRFGTNGGTERARID